MPAELLKLSDLHEKMGVSSSIIFFIISQFHEEKIVCKTHIFIYCSCKVFSLKHTGPANNQAINNEQGSCI